MGWISGEYDTLDEFEKAHPEAVVVISDTDRGIVAAVYEVIAKVCKIYAVQHVVVKEYRGLTQDLAELLKTKANAGCSKSAYRTEDGDSWAVVPMLVGTERTAVVSRSNEAGAYKLTVNETTIANADVTASWARGTNA